MQTKQTPGQREAETERERKGKTSQFQIPSPLPSTPSYTTSWNFSCLSTVPF